MKISENKYYRAYLIIILAVLTEALAFILRVGSALQIEDLFFKQHFLANAAEMTTIVLAAPFLGFAIALLVGSTIIDWVGMRTTLVLASLAFIVGTALTVFAPENQAIAFNYLRFGAFLTGLGWGSIESVINPLVIAIFPEDKVKRLSGAHAFWCAGIIVGGLLCVAVDLAGFSFQLKTSLVFIPAVLFGMLALRTEFPVTERVSSGVSTKDMFMEVVRRPSFCFWWILMFLGSLTELGASSFVDIALTEIVGMKGVWILIYVAIIMFIMRRNAGILSSRMSPVGVISLCMLFAAIGLYGLSISNSPITALLSATLWGIGASLLWPTMMGNISYRYPKGGAFFLGLIGLAACLGEWLLLPELGVIYDMAKINTAGSLELLKQIPPGSNEMTAVLTEAAGVVFQALAILTGALAVVYAIIWLVERLKKQRGFILE